MRHMTIGRAYALFRSTASINDIRRELNDMKDIVEVRLEKTSSKDCLALHVQIMDSLKQAVGIPPSIVALAAAAELNYSAKVAWTGYWPEGTNPNENASRVLYSILSAKSELFVPEDGRIYYGRNGGLNPERVELSCSFLC